MSTAIRENFPLAEDDGNRKLIVHADKARSQAARLVQTCCDESLIQIAPRHPYSGDLSPSDFWLFGDIKRHLTGQSFETRKELFDAV
jgi:hypothetical protein